MIEAAPNRNRNRNRNRDRDRFLVEAFADCADFDSHTDFDEHDSSAREMASLETAVVQPSGAAPPALMTVALPGKMRPSIPCSEPALFQ